jgi:hypothetical protein
MKQHQSALRRLSGLGEKQEKKKQKNFSSRLCSPPSSCFKSSAQNLHLKQQNLLLHLVPHADPHHKKTFFIL